MKQNEKNRQFFPLYLFLFPCLSLSLFLEFQLELITIHVNVKQKTKHTTKKNERNIYEHCIFCMALKLFAEF